MKGFKTVVFGILVGLTGLLSSPEFQTFVAEHLKVIGPLLGGAIVVLRALTKSSIFNK